MVNLSAAAIRPESLVPGDTICLVAPSSPFKSDIVYEAKKQLIAKGFNVKLASNLFQKKGYLAGDDKERAQALMEAFLDPEVKALWCVRGGYGSMRILDLLDYDLIRENPKIVIGMSDITALHVALLQNANLVTFLGPGAKAICVEGDSYGEEILWNILTNNFPINLPYATPKHFSSEAIVSGRCQGTLVGGNLAVICSLIGTPWQIKTEGKILLLEEVNEDLYRLDRMLFQLKNAGLLDGIAGLVLASFENCAKEEEDLKDLFREYFHDALYPV
ncbi:MAG: LD-carboxypeptidase, partial [Simkaniaceae bacterium]|nr:LD-carboxypeptidase [Simkaniaceae bacterium]